MNLNLMRHPILYVFPNGGPDLLVMFYELADGSEMRNVLEYFTLMYGAATLFDGKTLAYIGEERRKANRAAA